VLLETGRPLLEAAAVAVFALQPWTLSRLEAVSVTAMVVGAAARAAARMSISLPCAPSSRSQTVRHHHTLACCPASSFHETHSHLPRQARDKHNRHDAIKEN
jgi:hypothetical protein